MRNWGGGASTSTDPAAGTSTATDVPLKEHVRAIHLDHVWLVRERFMWLIGIGVIVWFEIQRRLELLNHENARLLTQQEKTVSSDTYEANESQRKSEAQRHEEWKKDVGDKLTKAATKEEVQGSTKDDRRQGVSSSMVIVATIVAALGFGLALLNRAEKTEPLPVVTITTTVGG